ncbi:hypothetical protein ALC53_10709 [Atta colombica]|uniref:Uncharacterized protein n=1 Tax=Atta colombica TaxID=520822 RepID=A0A151I026_9HYME|nr:hypothetical protein ALC53_10709 [Atta colombica]
MAQKPGIVMGNGRRSTPLTERKLEDHVNTKKKKTSRSLFSTGPFLYLSFPFFAT